MSTREAIRRRLLLQLFGSPFTLFPALAGVSAALSPVFFDLDPALPIFAGITGLAVAAGSVLIQLVVRKDDISAEVRAELDAVEAAGHVAQLEGLTERLRADGDPRTETLLSDLRALTGGVAQDAQWRQALNPAVVDDIMGGIDQLFDGCVHSLERTAHLHEMARDLGTPAAREALAIERAALIDEVEQSVTRLGHLVSELKVLGVQSGGRDSGLDRIRAEIDRNLDAARKSAAEAHGAGSGVGSPSDESIARRRTQRARAAKESPK